MTALHAVELREDEEPAPASPVHHRDISPELKEVLHMLAAFEDDKEDDEPEPKG